MSQFLHFVGHLVLVLLLGYYLIQNLQWYDYRLKRIIFHHHNPFFHILFFLVPLFAYFALREYVLILDLFYGVGLYWWQRKIDKRLVFTPRVVRFFLILLVLTLIIDLLFMAKFNYKVFSTLIPLAFALLVSNLVEQFLFTIYKKEAFAKLKEINPTIVGITASYGKTSIKNFLYQLLKERFEVYKTPRSVNTLKGIVKDINTQLPSSTQIYIVEAGARERGDIFAITKFLQPHYAIIGKIGAQHLEYFKSLENIVLTKLELLSSNRLKKAIIWEGIKVKDNPKFIKVGHNIKNVKATLDGVSWELEIEGKNYPFFAPLLGEFNALNISLAILLARELGIEVSFLQQKVKELKGVKHRLEKIEVGGKIIIDDSYNGNLEGMKASYKLVSSYSGRKVIVTPGIVESGEKINIELAKAIDEVFDLAIITAKVNKDILLKNLSIPTIFLEDKSKLQELLAKETKEGDLILFSNDAPSFL
ncbi:MAG: UDP-N-acetylmuramoyl-tripeptide--D-alanyl-D-alanine ligase [Epsilonproteobacteria bacterium]|nr:UDP-N-acetylmuramoyl-tripeptide--D-alanyl-D-alanine ligase [Campylobacterota bacterium]